MLGPAPETGDPQDQQRTTAVELLVILINTSCAQHLASDASRALSRKGLERGEGTVLANGLHQATRPQQLGLAQVRHQGLNTTHSEPPSATPPLRASPSSMMDGLQMAPASRTLLMVALLFTVSSTSCTPTQRCMHESTKGSASLHPTCSDLSPRWPVDLPGRHAALPPAPLLGSLELKIPLKRLGASMSCTGAATRAGGAAFLGFCLPGASASCSHQQR